MQLTGWGRYPRIHAQGTSFANEGELTAALQHTGKTPCIVHALGRSYGDSALAPNALLSRRMDSMLDFDAQSGVLICEAGVSLADIVESMLPRGWFLSTTPGTRFVSVGGAIASDVHGKNHHVHGCFSECVLWMDLMLPSGEVVRCDKNNTPELFTATCGGMGLTGVILRAAVQLIRVPGALIEQTVIKAQNLEKVFALFEEHGETTYSVAWIDCLAKAGALGRSLLMLGEHAATAQPRTPAKRKLSIPVEFPGFALNSYSVRLFNFLYYNKMRKDRSHGLVDIDSFFYPLDAIHHWNRIYGKGGFTQYQFVLPKASSHRGLRAILKTIADSGMGSFLAVLKLCGPSNKNLLSFPREGYSLALDFKIEPALFKLLDRLDAMVLEYGGRIYLTKDVRMSRATFEAGYPEIETFRALRSKLEADAVFQSLQSKRLEY